MATINDTKKVWDSDSENEECKYMYKINTPKGNSFCLNMRNNGFWNSDNILPPPKKKKKKKIAYALFSVSLGTAVVPGEIWKTKVMQNFWGK